MIGRSALTRRTVMAAPLVALAPTAHSESLPGERLDLRAVFARHGVTGASVIQMADGRQYFAYYQRAAERLVPASTFKIANSLIALETGVVKDDAEIIPYGGGAQPIKAWERDMNLRDAIAVSNVPVYQEIARRVGLPAYRQWLVKLDYGNAQTGDVVDRFWLDGPLEISAIEQARFAMRLATGDLPVSERAQGIVRDIVKFEQGGDYILHAKTGWAGGRIGWWTGWVMAKGGVAASFSLNIDMRTLDEAPKRIELGKSLLRAVGVLPSSAG